MKLLNVNMALSSPSVTIVVVRVRRDSALCVTGVIPPQTALKCRDYGFSTGTERHVNIVCSSLGSNNLDILHHKLSATLATVSMYQRYRMLGIASLSSQQFF